MNIISDSYLQKDIDALRNNYLTHWKKLRNNKSKLDKGIYELREKVLKLELMQLSMLQYMRRMINWNENEFKKIVDELDMSDGKLDGKIDKKKSPPPKKTKKVKKTVKLKK